MAVSGGTTRFPCPPRPHGSEARWDARRPRNGVPVGKGLLEAHSTRTARPHSPGAITHDLDTSPLAIHPQPKVVDRILHGQRARPCQAFVERPEGESRCRAVAVLRTNCVGQERQQRHHQSCGANPRTGQEPSQTQDRAIFRQDEQDPQDGAGPSRIGKMRCRERLLSFSTHSSGSSCESCRGNLRP